MKCIECGTKMTVSKEDYPYQSLPGVVLKGVETRRCSKCGEHEIVIPRIEELHRLLASTLVHISGRLLPAEIRFLRKYLGWSGADFARHFGVTPEHVSRWEQGKKRMSPVAERLLRFCVASEVPVEDYGVDQLETISQEERSLNLLAKWTRSSWKAVSKAA